METLALLVSNIISPPVIAFAAGVTAVLTRSDLKFPEQVYQALTIYLLLAIGFKGGAALAATGIAPLILPLLATLAIGGLIPVAVFFATRWFLRMSVANGAALAAHYGSVSAVTFMACLAFLDRQQMTYENYMPAIMAAMEIPAIFVAMLLAKRYDPESNVSLAHSVREVLAGKK